MNSRKTHVLESDQNGRKEVGKDVFLLCPPIPKLPLHTGLSYTRGEKDDSWEDLGIFIFTGASAATRIILGTDGPSLQHAARRTIPAQASPGSTPRAACCCHREPWNQVHDVFLCSANMRLSLAKWSLEASPLNSTNPVLFSLQREKQYFPLHQEPHGNDFP